MKRHERLFIYGALAVLGGLNLALIMGHDGQHAVASPEPLLDDLGPADMITLSSEGSDEDMVLRNRGGRVSWDDAATSRAYGIAFVHVGKILSQLIDSDQYVEERTALRDELQALEEDYTERLNAIRDRIAGMDPQSPEAQEGLAEGNRVLQEYRQWGQEAQRRNGELQAQHFELAYGDLVTAVNVVADDADIDIVLRFVPTDVPFDGGGPEQALLTIRARAALRYPEALDITPEVMEELSLSDDS